MFADNPLRRKKDWLEGLVGQLWRSITSPTGGVADTLLQSSAVVELVYQLLVVRVISLRVVL